MSARTQKLISLRARTDHDLVVLIDRKLDRGLALVGVAEVRKSPAFEQAERRYQTATILLSLISGVSEDDRLRIETKAAQLRWRLDQVPAVQNVPLLVSFAT